MTSTNDRHTDGRKTAMLIFRDDGVDWAHLAGEGRSKALFQEFDWATDLKRRGIYAGVDALEPSGKTVRRKAQDLSSTVHSRGAARRCSATSSCE